ncbi:MAG: hypothetical protein HFJ95_01485 [Muribaculaceae bacterium]|nr:hypothetical protein [Muribaculaceae bacterium]
MPQVHSTGFQRKGLYQFVGYFPVLTHLGNLPTCFVVSTHSITLCRRRLSAVAVTDVPMRLVEPPGFDDDSHRLSVGSCLAVDVSDVVKRLGKRQGCGSEQPILPKQRCHAILVRVRVYPNYDVGLRG